MNIKTEVKDNILTLRIDISKEVKASAPLSSSGKNKVVASTQGFLDVPQAGVKVGLNVICK